MRLRLGYLREMLTFVDFRSTLSKTPSRNHLARNPLRLRCDEIGVGCRVKRVSGKDDVASSTFSRDVDEERSVERSI